MLIPWKNAYTLCNKQRIGRREAQSHEPDNKAKKKEALRIFTHFYVCWYIR
jgi:hypothetical protein